MLKGLLLLFGALKVTAHKRNKECHHLICMKEQVFLFLVLKERTSHYSYQLQTLHCNVEIENDRKVYV